MSPSIHLFSYPMAILCCFTPSPLFHSPAKITIPILCTPSFVLRPPLLSSSLAKAISKNPPRATTPPQKYVYRDPIPEFAESETKRFRIELRKKLSKEKEIFGDDLDQVVEVCSQIFRDFLHKDYGGPGTLLVEPFTDMLISLKQKKLPGASFAARTALLWAQNYVDEDWEHWNSNM